MLIIVQGEGLSLEVDEFFYSSSARNKSLSKYGLIAVGKVLHGKIVPGEKVEMFFPNGAKIADHISMVEVEGQKRGFAQRGEDVGICFSSLRLRDVRRAAEQAA